MFSFARSKMSYKVMMEHNSCVEMNALSSGHFRDLLAGHVSSLASTLEFVALPCQHNHILFIQVQVKYKQISD